MKDERGLYYYPSLQNRETRMYVREEDGQILYRLWSSSDPRIWDGHGWIPRHVVEAAAQKYKDRGRDRNPLGLYDENVAARLLEEDRRTGGNS